MTLDPARPRSCRLLLAGLLFWGAASAGDVDWAQVERDYQKEKAELIRSARVRPYSVPTPGGTFVFDTRPEFGVGVHNPTPEALDRVRDAGIRLVRHTLYWYEVENTEAEGVYNGEALAKYDARFRDMEARGIIPVVVIHGNPPGTTFATRQAGYQRFAKFLAFCGRRWPYVRYFELWNEMDYSFTDLFGAGVKENDEDVPMARRGAYYVEMLRLAYPALKAVRPDAVVLLGGMGDYGEFARGIYAAGGKDYFDVMNLHTYGMPATWVFVINGRKLRQLMDANGDADKPLWNTEFGIDAGAVFQAWGPPGEAAMADGGSGGYFDRQQRDQIRECLEWNREAKVYQKVLAYQWDAGLESWRDMFTEALASGRLAPLPEGRGPDDYGFGLVRADGRTLRPMLEWLRESRYNDPARLETPVAVTLSPDQPGGPAATVVNSDYPAFLPAP